MNGGNANEVNVEMSSFTDQFCTALYVACNGYCFAGAERGH